MVCIESGIGVAKGVLSVVGTALDAWFAGEVALGSWTEVEAVFELGFWAVDVTAFDQQSWAAFEAGWGSWPGTESEVGLGSWPAVGVEAAVIAEAVFGIVV